MKKIMLVIAIGLLLLTGCQKRSNSANINEPAKTTINSREREGEDGDIIIVIKTKNYDDYPISNAYVSVKNDSDTYTGIADSQGVCILKLSELGDFEAFVTCNGYLPQTKGVKLVDSITTLDVYLQELK